MRNSAALRLVSHICIFLSASALLPFVHNGSYLPYCFIILAALISYLTVLRKSVSMRGEIALDEVETTKRRARRKKRGLVPETNADRVRYAYRCYLSYLRKHGIVRKPGSTSGDISSLASAILAGENDELLRSLYLKARYSGAAVTSEDADAAEEAYLQLVSGKTGSNDKAGHTDSGSL